MKLIGLTGKMGSGKSTAVEHMKALYHPGIVQLIKFAQPLYDIQEYAYNRMAKAYKRPENFVKDRKLLQFLGTDWIRDTLGEDVLIDQWKNDVLISCSMGYDIIVCDDVRYDNEAQAIKSVGGSIIEIISEHSVSRIDTKAGIDGHKSEAGISDDLIDYAVVNNSSIMEYKNALHNVFKLALEKKE